MPLNQPDLDQTGHKGQLPQDQKKPLVVVMKRSLTLNSKKLTKEKVKRAHHMIKQTRMLFGPSSAGLR